MAPRPTRPGTFWKFESTTDGKTSEFTWKITKLGDEKIKLVDHKTGQKSGLGIEFIDLKKDAKDFFAVRNGKEIVMILRNRGGEISVYRKSFGNYFILHWQLTTEDLMNEKPKKMPRVFMSCGFGMAWFKTEIKKETVKVPAGEFTAFKVTVKSGRWSDDTMWLVPGVGIVKWTERRATHQLVKWGVPKEGR